MPAAQKSQQGKNRARGRGLCPVCRRPDGPGHNCSQRGQQGRRPPPPGEEPPPEWAEGAVVVLGGVVRLFNFGVRTALSAMRTGVGMVADGLTPSGGKGKGRR